VAPTFVDADIAYFPEKIIEQSCALSRGPCKYTGDPRKIAARQAGAAARGDHLPLETGRQFSAI